MFINRVPTEKMDTLFGSKYKRRIQFSPVDDVIFFDIKRVSTTALTKRTSGYSYSERELVSKHKCETSHTLSSYFISLK